MDSLIVSPRRSCLFASFSLVFFSIKVCANRCFQFSQTIRSTGFTTILVVEQGCVFYVRFNGISWNGCALSES